MKEKIVLFTFLISKKFVSAISASLPESSANTDTTSLRNCGGKPAIPLEEPQRKILIAFLMESSLMLR